MSECKDCLMYEGNCGFHFRWTGGQIDKEIPCESMFDGVIGDTPRCFKPSKEYQDKINKRIAEDISKYPKDVLLMALKIKEEEVNNVDQTQ